MRRLAIVAGVIVVLLLASDPGRFGVGSHCNREQADEDHLVVRCQVADSGWPCRNRTDCEFECVCTKMLATGTPARGRCVAELPVNESYCVVEHGVAAQRLLQ